MNWKKWLLGLAAFAVIAEAHDFLCNDKPSKEKKVSNESSDREPTIEPKVNPLDTSLSYSTYLVDYLPDIFDSEQELREYVKDYAEFCDDFYSSLDSKFEMMAKMAGVVSSAEEKSTDAIDGGKKIFNALGTLGSGLGTMASTVWDAKGVVGLDSDRKELAKKYSENVMDTVLAVEQYLNNYAFYSYVEFLSAESEKIKSYNSVWSQPSSFTAEYFGELGFERSRDLLMAFREDAARIRKILIYNQMKGVESPHLQPELEKLQSFWSSDDTAFETDAKLFNQVSSSVARLKADLLQKQKALDQKQALWNEDAVKETRDYIGRFNDVVEQDIDRLNVYDLSDTDWSFFHE